MNIIIFQMKFVNVIGYYANLIANAITNMIVNVVTRVPVSTNRSNSTNESITFLRK